MAQRSAVVDGHRDDRIVTIPNLITVVRLALLPVFVWLLFNDHRVASAWLLGALGVTDFLDGYIARRFDQGSNLGKVLDPVADRLLFFVGVGAILIDGAMPLWFAVLLLIREVLIAAGTLALAAMGARRVDVTWYGKAATLFNMFAVPMWLGYDCPDLSFQSLAGVLAYATSVPGLVLGYYSVALYVPIAKRALSEGRAARAGVGSPP
ncbi:MAG: CDP-alcohol phosphatidyltransferase family protein [Acidimicrobiales bacterium]